MLSRSQTDTERVVAIQREVVLNGQPAARSERQILAHPIVLHEERRHLVGFERRTDRRIADRDARNLCAADR